MTEANRPLKVFLCHTHADWDTVRTLCNRLTMVTSVIKQGIYRKNSVTLS